MSERDEKAAEAVKTTMETDLRALAQAARVEHPAVREAAERAVMRMRSGAPEASVVDGDALRPFLLACHHARGGSRESDVVSCALGALQHLAVAGAIPASEPRAIIRVLAIQAGSPSEKIRVRALQTLPLVLSQSPPGSVGAGAIGDALSLGLRVMREDANVGLRRTAAATVRQACGIAFERTGSEETVHAAGSSLEASVSLLRDLSLALRGRGARSLPRETPLPPALAAELLEVIATDHGALLGRVPALRGATAAAVLPALAAVVASARDPTLLVRALRAGVAAAAAWTAETELAEGCEAVLTALARRLRSAALAAGGETEAELRASPRYGSAGARLHAGGMVALQSSPSERAQGRAEIGANSKVPTPQEIHILVDAARAVAQRPALVRAAFNLKYPVVESMARSATLLARRILAAVPNARMPLRQGSAPPPSTPEGFFLVEADDVLLELETEQSDPEEPDSEPSPPTKSEKEQEAPAPPPTKKETTSATPRLPPVSRRVGGFEAKEFVGSLDVDVLLHALSEATSADRREPLALQSDVAAGGSVGSGKTPVVTRGGGSSGDLTSSAGIWSRAARAVGGLWREEEEEVVWRPDAGALVLWAVETAVGLADAATEGESKAAARASLSVRAATRLEGALPPLPATAERAMVRATSLAATMAAASLLSLAGAAGAVELLHASAPTARDPLPVLLGFLLKSLERRVAAAAAVGETALRDVAVRELCFAAVPAEKVPPMPEETMLPRIVVVDAAETYFLQQTASSNVPLLCTTDPKLPLTRKHAAALQRLVNLAHCHGPLLGRAWVPLLASLETLDAVLAARAARDARAAEDAASRAAAARLARLRNASSSSKFSPRKRRLRLAKTPPPSSRTSASPPPPPSTSPTASDSTTTASIPGGGPARLTIDTPGTRPPLAREIEEALVMLGPSLGTLVAATQHMDTEALAHLARALTLSAAEALQPEPSLVAPFALERFLELAAHNAYRAYVYWDLLSPLLATLSAHPSPALRALAGQAAPEIALAVLAEVDDDDDDADDVDDDGNQVQDHPQKAKAPPTKTHPEEKSREDETKHSADSGPRPRPAILLGPLVDLWSSPFVDARASALEGVRRIAEEASTSLWWEDEYGESGWDVALGLVGLAADSAAGTDHRDAATRSISRAPLHVPSDAAAAARAAFATAQGVADAALAALPERALQRLLQVFGALAVAGGDVNLGLATVTSVWAVADEIGRRGERASSLWDPLVRLLASLAVPPARARGADADAVAVVPREMRTAAVEALFGALTAHAGRIPSDLWGSLLADRVLPLAVEVTAAAETNREWASAHLAALQGASRAVAAAAPALAERAPDALGDAWSGTLALVERALCGARSAEVRSATQWLALVRERRAQGHDGEDREGSSSSSASASKTYAPDREAAVTAARCLVDLCLLVCSPAGPARAADDERRAASLRVVDGALVAQNSEGGDAGSSSEGVDSVVVAALPGHAALWADCQSVLHAVARAPAVAASHADAIPCAVIDAFATIAEATAATSSDSPSAPEAERVAAAADLTRTLLSRRALAEWAIANVDSPEGALLPEALNGPRLDAPSSVGRHAAMSITRIGKAAAATRSATAWSAWLRLTLEAASISPDLGELLRAPAVLPPPARAADAARAATSLLHSLPPRAAAPLANLAADALQPPADAIASLQQTTALALHTLGDLAPETPLPPLPEPTLTSTDSVFPVRLWGFGSGQEYGEDRLFVADAAKTKRVLSVCGTILATHTAFLASLAHIAAAKSKTEPVLRAIQTIILDNPPSDTDDSISTPPSKHPYPHHTPGIHANILAMNAAAKLEEEDLWKAADTGEGGVSVRAAFRTSALVTRAYARRIWDGPQLAQLATHLGFMPSSSLRGSPPVLFAHSVASLVRAAAHATKDKPSLHPKLLSLASNLTNALTNPRLQPFSKATWTQSASQWNASRMLARAVWQVTTDWAATPESISNSSTLVLDRSIAMIRMLLAAEESTLRYQEGSTLESAPPIDVKHPLAAAFALEAIIVLRRLTSLSQIPKPALAALARVATCTEPLPRHAFASLLEEDQEESETTLEEIP